MRKDIEENYKICCAIIQLAQQITKENPDKTYYFTTQAYVGRKKVKMSTEDMLKENEVVKLDP